MTSFAVLLLPESAGPIVMFVSWYAPAPTRTVMSAVASAIQPFVRIVSIAYWTVAHGAARVPRPVVSLPVVATYKVVGAHPADSPADRYSMSSPPHPPTAAAKTA